MEAHTKKTPNSQSNTKKKSNPGIITMPYFKLYYRELKQETICFASAKKL
jgi:hypothetical protein